MDGVKSKDSEDDADWWPSPRGKVLAAGNNVCGVIEW